jgi:hypothetical protein
MAGGDEVGCFPEIACGVQVMQPGHGNVGAYVDVGGRAEQPLIGGCLGLLRQLLGPVGGGEFSLLGLAHQLICLLEVAGLDRGLGALDEIAGDRVLRIERRQPRHCRFVLRGNLGKLLWQLFEGNILLADDAEHLDGGALGDAKGFAEIDDAVCERSDGAGRGSRC